jgi:hypothetical protein
VRLHDGDSHRFYVSLPALYIRRLSLVDLHHDIEFHIKTRSWDDALMVLAAIAWTYVVLMVAVVEASSPQGTLLGALFTVLLYGVLPLGIGGYLFLGPARRRARRAAQASTADPLDPDGGGHAARGAVAAERVET